MGPARRSSGGAILALAVLCAPLACDYDWPLPDLAAEGGADAGDAAPGGDATLPSDGATADAGDPLDCASAFFCERFLTGPAVSAPWDTFAKPGGTVRVEDFEGAPSPPGTLLAARDTTNQTPSASYIHRIITQPLRRASLSFWIHPTVMDNAGARACVAGISFKRQGDSGQDVSHNFRILIGATTGVLEDSAPTFRSLALSSVPPPGEWTRVELIAELGGRGKVVIGGKDAIYIELGATPAVSDETTFTVGINFISAPTDTGFALHFDDVRASGSN